MRRAWVLPFVLAVILTGTNALKAVVVDDTAYLLFARHLALHPTHPYDFELFWYNEPQPANEILMPPVLPYWLAAGIALFGEQLFLLKLWLFPIAWLLTASLDSLLRKFARGKQNIGLIVLVLSPAILPQFNFMLDVPAVAFGLAAMALFVRSTDKLNFTGMIAAGFLAGVAMQTKYTQLVIPAVFAAYGLCQRRWLPPLVAIGAAAIAFAGWEAIVQARCGQSHFLIHFRETAGSGDSNSGFFTRILKRFDEAPSLISQLGGVALGFALWGLRIAGVARWLLPVFAAFALIPLGFFAFLPYSRAGDPAWFFFLLGIASLLGTASFLSRFLVVPSKHRMLPWLWSRDTAFLVLWLLVELGGTMVLSPFSAARRVIGVALVIGLIAARGISRFDRIPGHRTPKWLAVVAVAWGIALTAIDTWDADAEREAVVNARKLIPETPGGTIWTTGHWGYQYYADIHGMTQLVPDKVENGELVVRWQPKPGDWLVMPVMPDLKEGWFYRPWPPMPKLPEGLNLRAVGDVVIDDRFPAQTVPNMYGGQYVIRGRDYPRLKLTIYRIGE